jgi:hypothetical protein
MAKRQLAAVAIGLAFLGATAAGAQTWRLTVASGGVGVSSSDLKLTPPNQITGASATVQVTCQTPADCANVGLRLEKNGTVVVNLGQTPAGSNSFQVPAGPVQGTTMDLAVTFQGTKINAFPVTAAAASANAAGNPAAGGNATGGSATGGAPANTPSNNAGANVSITPQLAELVTTSCPSTTVQVHYDARNNQVVVTPTGNVLARAVDTFDENDSLRVVVYGDARLLPLLKVQRTSAFRDSQTVRIVGAGLTIPQTSIAREGAGVCTTAEYVLDNFEPGQATVQISAFQTSDWVPLGGFDFNVDPLYTGMLSLGAAWTRLVDPGYKLASDGTQTVIALGDQGNRDLLYSLFYTPYVWGKRDLAKKIPTGQWYKHINPSIGIVPQEIDQNAFVGLTVDLPAGILLTYGRHFRQITVLPASTGLTVGSPFSGTADQIPTTRSWENGSFFAVTVDLRAMVQLLTAAVSGRSGGGS